MSRLSDFEINISETFPRLDHAPIVEAVIQFSAPPTKNVEPAQLKERLSQLFPTCKITDQLQVEAGFSGSPAGMALSQRTHWDGLRIATGDERHICQWKHSRLIVSRLAPYRTWENFLTATLPFWEAYREVHAPEVIENIGVRFISQIEIKQNQRISDFVAKTPPPLKGLGLRSESFFHQDTIPVPGHPYEIRLIRTMQRSVETGDAKSILIVDIDVSTTAATLFNELDQSLQELRFLKNKVFFAYMKDAKNKFK